MFKVSKQVLIDVTANARLSWVASTPAISTTIPTAAGPVATSESASPAGAVKSCWDCRSNDGRRSCTFRRIGEAPMVVAVTRSLGPRLRE